MKYGLTVILMTALCVGFSMNISADDIPSGVPSENGFDNSKLEKIKPMLQSMVDRHQTAGIVWLIARKGKVIQNDSVGMMDISAGKPMQLDTIFRIYSMTKPITTTAAMMLLEEGRFQLDDPVSKYLPELKDLRVWSGKGEETVTASREMTIRDLMRHTSGFSYGMSNSTFVDKLYHTNRIGDGNDTLADLVTKLGKIPLQYQPGKRFNYSVSTDVLGRLIEVVSKKPLDEFFQERIFTPLDMRDTGFFVPDDKVGRFAANMGPGSEKGTLKVIDAPATSRFRKKPKYLSGGGGLVSTARDYLRFSQMILNGGELQGRRLLKAETVKQMLTNQLPSEAMPMNLGGIPVPGMGFGLGFSVKMDDTAEAGWSGAASTFFWISPKKELVIIALEQYMPLSLRLELAFKPRVYSAIQKE